MPWLGSFGWLGHGTGSQTYSEKLASVFGSSIISHWPLWEAAGPTVNDIIGGHNGTYTNAVPGSPGIGDGNTSTYFDGTGDYADVFSAGLAAALTGPEGSVLLWAKVAAASVWSDGAARYLFDFMSVDNNNRIRGYKNSADANVYLLYTAGGNQKYAGNVMSTTAWFHVGLTWSASNDRLRIYFAGSKIGADVGTLGTWAAAIALAKIGSSSDAGANNWNGYLAHVLLLDREATATEVSQAATV